MMNEELVEKRLSDIEKKIDQIMEIINQTNLQEYRIKVLEKEIMTIKPEIIKLQKSPGDVALKWLGIIGAGVATILLSFIAAKIGLK